MPAVFVCLLCVAASAQPPRPAGDEADPAADVIVVTGERVPRLLRETPSSVRVFTGEQIERQPGADRLEDLLAQVPNVQLGNGSQGPAIRGQDSTGPLRDLPAFLGGNRPRVTLQVDGRAVGYSEFVFGIAPLWDVGQVEVFRSPQTTTQGPNAIAGAIFIRTSDPEFDWSAKARAIAGNLDTRQISAAVTGPLVADQIAFRIAGDLRVARPASRIADNAVGADPNRDDYGLLRVKLLAQPSALPGARLTASFVHTESQMPQIEGVVAPFRQRRDPFALYGTFGTNIDSLTGQLTVPLSRDVNVSATLSAGDSRSRRYAPELLGQARIHSRDRSLEALLDWRAAEALRLHGGVHLLRTRLEQRINLFAFEGLGMFEDAQDSAGLFGEIEVEPAPRLALTAGLRYQKDSQDRSGVRAIDGASIIDFDRAFSAWLPKVTATYALTDSVSSGILVQRAYNPGGATLNFETGGPELFGAETLWDYELFARAVFAGGKVRLNGNLFHNRFTNAQRTKSRFLVIPPRRLGWAEIENVPKAEARGLEASLDWRASHRLTLRGAAGLLDTKIVDGGTFAAIDGKDFQRAPRFSGSAAVEWQPVDQLRLSGSVRHHGRYFSDDENTPQLRIGSGTIIDARMRYQRGPIAVFGYARNLFDAFNLQWLGTPTSGTADDPREVGIGLEARF